MNDIVVGNILSVYFSRLFPFNCFHKWLSYGNEKTFTCREFAFNFGGERFLRHQSYTNLNEFKKAVKRLQPSKIDVGAVYNIPPLNNIREKFFHPTQKELIFDIDVTDYDDVRTCCSGTDMCVKCWEYMVIAVKILDTALREDFGYKHILWAFSGRRGIHCWVCDSKARLLRRNVRWGLATYLQIVTGGEFMKKKVEIGTKIHPSVKRALNVIEPVFKRMCIENQDIFYSEQSVSSFLGIIANDEMRKEVKNVLDQYSTSITKWEAFVDFFREQIKLGIEKWCSTPFLIEEIMLQYAYPRLDINVTLGMSHLLKAPFCIHPKTGKIGVPIDPKDIDNFDPFSIPTVSQLLDEIDEYDKKTQKEGMTTQELKQIEDIQKTSLRKYVCTFEKFIYDLDEESDINLTNEVNLESDNFS